MKYTKEVIAGYADRLSDITVDMGLQIGKVQTTYKQRYFINLLQRQVELLRDVAESMRNHDILFQSNTFILGRCLIDDFITVLYFKVKEFDEEVINCHVAKAYRSRFDAMQETVNINLKYFEGKEVGLIDKELYDEQWNSFKSNPNNRMLFKMNTKTEVSDTLKGFPPTSQIMRTLPGTDVGKANASAFVLWKLYSNYIHYSIMTYQFKESPNIRDYEIWMMRECLSYVAKTIVLSSEALNQFGIVVELKDPTDVIEDIMRNHRTATD